MKPDTIIDLLLNRLAANPRLPWIDSAAARVFLHEAVALLVRDRHLLDALEDLHAEEEIRGLEEEVEQAEAQLLLVQNEIKRRRAERAVSEAE